MTPAAPASGVAVEAPMPGSVFRIDVKVGDAVKAGDSLVVIVAMKMENPVLAPKDGKVVAVNVNQGDVVVAGQSLVTLG